MSKSKSDIREACETFLASWNRPGEAIRDAAGNIVGCRGLCQIGGAS